MWSSGLNCINGDLAIWLVNRLFPNNSSFARSIVRDNSGDAKPKALGGALRWFWEYGKLLSALVVFRYNLK